MIGTNVFRPIFSLADPMRIFSLKRLRRCMRVLDDDKVTSILLQVLFTMGSPVGLFMHTSDKIPNRSHTLPEGSLGLHWKWMKNGWTWKGKSVWF